MEEIAQGDSAVWHSNRGRPRQRATPRRARGARRRKLAVAARTSARRSSPRSVEHAADGDDWLHEMKYDGYRCSSPRTAPTVRCYTRNGQDWTDKFRRSPMRSPRWTSPGALIDGEIVAFAPDGRTDFSTLQNALSEDSGALDFFAFDLLEEDGEDITEAAAGRTQEPAAGAARRSAEGRAASISARTSRGDGADGARADVRGRATRASSPSWPTAPYRERAHARPGSRSSAASGRNSSSAAGALRQARAASLAPPRHAGRTASSSIAAASAPASTTARLEDLSARFDEARAQGLAVRSGAARHRARRQWVEPKLVAEIDFTEFTSDGILRHPSFLGLARGQDGAAR